MLPTFVSAKARRLCIISVSVRRHGQRQPNVAEDWPPGTKFTDPSMRVGVLGGGLQGCCAALALAERGAKSRR